MKPRIFIVSLISIFLIREISAHCPLCTIGAGAAAGAAVWLGVSKVVVALFIGAFAMSMGMWFARILDKKKKYIPFQHSLVVIGVFLLTILPLIPIVKVIGPLYLSFIGAYGKTYALNYSLVSGLFGGLLVLFAPSISKKITDLRNGKMLPFQGILITFLLLIIAGGIIQLLV
jgi:hypothetical protein